MPKFNNALLAGTAMGLCLVTVPTIAEDIVVSDDDQPIEEIIVTSEKLGRTIKETTTSVMVFTGEALEQRSVADVYDVVLRTPNVGQSFGNKGFNIRGIDQRAGGGDGLLVNVIVDGAALPTNQATFFGPYSAWDIGQIEILRGPQGTTQGRNAIGGAIVINSADPVMGEFSGKVRASYAELNSYQLAGALNVPLVGDELALRLSVEKRGTDGWVENITRNEDYDERDALTARAKLRWEPTDRLSLMHTFNYTDSTGGEDEIDFTRFPEERVNIDDAEASEGSKHYINTFRVDYDLTDAFSLTSFTTFYKNDYARLEDLDGSPTPISVLDRTQEDTSFIQEVRVSYNDGGRLRGIFGGYYGDFESDFRDTFSVPAAFVVDAQILIGFGIDPTTPVFQDRSQLHEEKNYAVFGELEYDVTERLTLIAGARYDDESRDRRAQATTTVDPAVVLPFPLPSEDPINTSASYNAFLPKFALRYEVSDETTLGLSAQKAYRAGGVAIASISGTVAPFDPETAWTYEASMRSSFAEGKFFLDANVFYTRWTDQIVNRLTQFGIDNNTTLDIISDNAGKSRLFGFELQGQAFWTEEFSTFFNVGYTNTKYQEFETPTAEFSGNRFEYSAPWSVAFGADYKHDSGFVARFDINWRDDAFSVSNNDPLSVATIVGLNGLEIQGCAVSPCNDPATTLEDRFVANAKVGYEADQWSVYLFARNLFDADYATQVQQVGRNLVTQLPEQLAVGAEPRVVGVEFNFKFGN